MRKTKSLRTPKAAASMLGVVVVLVIIAILSIYALKGSGSKSPSSPQSQPAAASNAAAVSAAQSMAQDAIAIARTQSAPDPGASNIVASAMSDTGITTYSPAGSTGTATRYQITYDGGTACVAIPSDSSPATASAGVC